MTVTVCGCVMYGLWRHLVNVFEINLVVRQIKKKKNVTTCSVILHSSCPSRFVVEIRMPFRRGAIRRHSTAATARDSSNQSRPPGMRRRHVLRAHRRVRVLWRWVIGCKGLQIRPISAKELEIQPIRAVLPACNARHGIKGTAPSFLRISFSDAVQK